MTQSSLKKDPPVIPLQPADDWHDPLKLIQNSVPSSASRIVLWIISLLMLILMLWAAIGQIDIIVSAEGKIVPQTLLKIVQPAEAGVVKSLLVKEGDSVTKGQVLVRLDATLANADKASISHELTAQQMQMRRIEAQLNNHSMLPKAGDDPILFAQVNNQYIAYKNTYENSLAHEQSLLHKAQHEKRSAEAILNKLEQTTPTYQRTAEAYAKLQKEGYVSGLANAEKQREATEKINDLVAQRATVAALNATLTAQQKKLHQLHSAYQSELHKEFADIHAKIQQLEPSLDKSIYREGLMELRAPQNGIIKDVATTTVGAVVQPGTVVFTVVPEGEQLFADVNINNENVGFVHVGQSAQIKLAAYPFQRHGMLTGRVVHLSADATELNQPGANAGNDENKSDNPATNRYSSYKARIQLDHQILADPHGLQLLLTPGMQVVAEINQGKRTVLEYLLSPVRKTISEAGRER